MSHQQRSKNHSAEIKLNDRIEQFNQHEAFVTLKDHKVNFQNDSECSLINPAKSEIGIISEHYLELINNKISEKKHKLTNGAIINPLWNSLKQSTVRVKFVYKI